MEARPETVFEFFTDPEKMVRWMGAAATLDPRPGGVFSVNMFYDHYVSGEYLEVEPPKRVVFTWGYDEVPGVRPNPLPPGASTVEVELAPDGEATLVRLVHRAPEPFADFHSRGWANYLPRLAIAAAGGEPGPDPFRDYASSLIARDD